MASTDVESAPAQGELTPDETISRSVRTLLAHHGLAVKHLEERIDGLKTSTVYTRLKGDRSWEAREVAVLSEFFGLPIGQFYTGQIQPFDSRLAEGRLRLSRKCECAGQGRFSGSDIDFLCGAVETSVAAA